ncbi:MAG: HIT domain-containing protein [Treponema sp.]|nr:HIT domain-containing protein [Treponema sp.]
MCIFCDEIKNPKLAKQLLGEEFQYEDRVLYSDDYVLALAGYGPQVFPYVLVLTKRHINSFAKTSNIERAHVLDCLKWLVKCRIFSSSKLCIFEHGGASISGSSSIDHFHLHVIDNSIGFFNSIDWKNDQVIYKITEKNMFEDYKNYLMIGIYENDCIEAKINMTNIKEPQYFRKKLALLLNSEQWDWKTGMNSNYISDLIALINKR